MSGRDPLWRAILWVERFLPTPWAVPDVSSPTVKRSRWRSLVLLPILMISPVASSIRHRFDWIAEWRVWQPTVLNMLLLVAAAVMLAAVGAGVMAWREVTRSHA